MTFRVLPPLPRLTDARTREVRGLMDAAFAGDFSEADWAHALGGRHVLALAEGAVVGHAAAAPRRLWVGPQPVEAAYVEAVAVAPAWQRRGVGAALMRALHPWVDAHALGALSTGEAGFYRRLGWTTWRGPSGVREGDAVRWTPEEDGGLMVRRTPHTGPLDPTAPLLCAPRSGDDW